MSRLRYPRLYRALMVRMIQVCAVLVVPTVLLLYTLHWSGHYGGVAWVNAGRGGTLPQVMSSMLLEGEACLEQRSNGASRCVWLMDGPETTRGASTYIPRDEPIPDDVRVGQRTLPGAALRRLRQRGRPVAGMAGSPTWMATIIVDPGRGTLVTDVTDAFLDRTKAASAAEVELRTSDGQLIAGTWRGLEGGRIAPVEVERGSELRSVTFDGGYQGYEGMEAGVSFARGATQLQAFYATRELEALEGFEPVEVVLSVPSPVMLYYVQLTIGIFAALTVLLLIAMALALNRVARTHLDPIAALVGRVEVLRQRQDTPSGVAPTVPAGGSYELNQLVAAIDRLEAQWSENQVLTRQLAEEQEAVQEATLRSLREKETLLKEIHHRVKNNLQVISSLLMLQRNQLDDETLRDVLNESISRVRSMSLVHQQLYGIESLSHIDLEAYTTELVTSLRAAFGQQGSIAVEVDAGAIDIDQAVPVALILNELLTNAMKYGQGGAAPEGQADVGVEMRRLANDRVEIAVTNYGPELPEDFDPLRAQGLGLKLIQSLVRQLRGTLELDRGGHTRFVVAFTAVARDRSVAGVPPRAAAPSS